VPSFGSYGQRLTLETSDYVRSLRDASRDSRALVGIACNRLYTLTFYVAILLIVLHTYYAFDV